MDAQIYQFRKQPPLVGNPLIFDSLAVMHCATRFMSMYAGSMLAFHVAMVRSGINAMTGAHHDLNS